MYTVRDLRQAPQETSVAIAYELLLIGFTWVSLLQSNIAGYSEDERIMAKLQPSPI